MQFYILAGFSIIAVAFLIMVAVQLFRIEKVLVECTELTEHRVKKIYQKG